LPVRRIKPLEAHDASAARRVDEHTRVERDADVRRARGDRREEDQVAGVNRGRIHVSPHQELLGDGARQGDGVLQEHVPDEAAAVEAGVGRRAAELIPHATETKGRLDHRGGRRDPRVRRCLGPRRG
jgi:hypothetical protein